MAIDKAGSDPAPLQIMSAFGGVNELQRKVGIFADPCDAISLDGNRAGLNYVIQVTGNANSPVTPERQ